jgi:hypothetical protein
MERARPIPRPNVAAWHATISASPPAAVLPIVPTVSAVAAASTVAVVPRRVCASRRSGNATRTYADRASANWNSTRHWQPRQTRPGALRTRIYLLRSWKRSPHRPSNEGAPMSTCCPDARSHSSLDEAQRMDGDVSWAQQHRLWTELRLPLQLRLPLLMPLFLSPLPPPPPLWASRNIVLWANTAAK